jgi:hypothetical protein
MIVTKYYCMRDSTLGVDTWFAQDNTTQLHTINRNGPINKCAADNRYRCFIFALSESIVDKLLSLRSNSNVMQVGNFLK